MSPADTRGVVETQKRSAALEALDEVSSGMRLGLGTGSTVRFFLEGLAERLHSGRLSDIRGVPTSLDTEARCRTLGIPTAELHEVGALDLAVDGADEVSLELNLVKGLGGALLREKIVAQASSRFVVIADAGKVVQGLGERAPIPIEIIPFAWRAQLPFLRSLGGEPIPREDARGELVVTDNGNHLVDLRFSDGIEDPERLDDRLRSRAGVLEHGLFLGMTDLALIGTETGVDARARTGAL